MSNLDNLNVADSRAQHKGAPLTLFDPTLLKPAIVDSFKKLAPQVQWRNPVMFVVYIGSILTTLLFFQAITGQGEAPAGFILGVALWLWFTVLFVCQFCRSLGRGPQQGAGSGIARGEEKRHRQETLRHGTRFRRATAGW